MAPSPRSFALFDIKTPVSNLMKSRSVLWIFVNRYFHQMNNKNDMKIQLCPLNKKVEEKNKLGRVLSPGHTVAWFDGQPRLRGWPGQPK